MCFDGFVHKAPIQLESSHCPGGQKTSGCETLAFAPWQHVPSYCWPSSSVRWASVLRSGPIVLGYSYHPASTCTTSARNGQAPVRNCQICVLRPFVCAIFSRLFACGSRAARRTLALPRLTRARASLAGECHLKDYMRVECCASCRAAAALQEVTFFAHPFFAHPPISLMRRTPILPISHVSSFASSSVFAHPTAISRRLVPKPRAVLPLPVLPLPALPRPNATNKAPRRDRAKLPLWHLHKWRILRMRQLLPPQTTPQLLPPQTKPHPQPRRQPPAVCSLDCSACSSGA